ncbi:unnamed protein product [Calicophoron daubneyi]|uniref:Uncharacterized protein n=1 Tax=Calicophoron daubneyi TaxID=300641 RepID=A0AAV2T8F1_CALDB
MRGRSMRWNVGALCGTFVFLVGAVCRAAEVVASTNCTDNRNGVLLDGLGGELFSSGSDPRYYFSPCGLLEVFANASTIRNHSVMFVRISSPEENKTISSQHLVERFYSPEAPVILQNRRGFIRLVNREDEHQVLCLISLACGKKNFSLVMEYNGTGNLLLFDLAHPKLCETNLSTTATSILAICFSVLLVFCIVRKFVYHRTWPESVPHATVCAEACGCCRRAMSSRRLRNIETRYTRIPTSPPASPMESVKGSNHSAATMTTGPHHVVFEQDPQDDLLLAL